MNENLKLLFDSDSLSSSTHLENLLNTLSLKENFKRKIWIPLRLKYSIFKLL